MPDENIASALEVIHSLDADDRAAADSAITNAGAANNENPNSQRPRSGKRQCSRSGGFGSKEASCKESAAAARAAAALSVSGGDPAQVGITAKLMYWFPATYNGRGARCGGNFHQQRQPQASCWCSAHYDCKYPRKRRCDMAAEEFESRCIACMRLSGCPPQLC